MSEKELNQDSSDVIEAIQGLAKHIDKRFDEVDQRFDRIEFLVTGQEQRLSIAEDKIRQLATHLGLTLLK
jgi:hypothetical protein